MVAMRRMLLTTSALIGAALVMPEAVAAECGPAVR
jgi:hypothetical protein